MRLLRGTVFSSTLACSLPYTSTCLFRLQGQSDCLCPSQAHTIENRLHNSMSSVREGAPEFDAARGSWLVEPPSKCLLRRSRSRSPTHTWAHPFSIKTCISLIRQSFPCSERSAPALDHEFNLLVIRTVFNLVEVVQRQKRFDQMPIRLRLIEGHIDADLTAA